jgi:hypothetical protein
VLPVAYNVEFLRPLLPAPLQVIGLQLSTIGDTKESSKKKARKYSFKSASKLLGKVGRTMSYTRKQLGVKARSASILANGSGGHSIGTLAELKHLVKGLTGWENEMGTDEGAETSFGTLNRSDQSDHEYDQLDLDDGDAVDDGIQEGGNDRGSDDEEDEL